MCYSLWKSSSFPLCFMSSREVNIASSKSSAVASISYILNALPTTLFVCLRCFSSLLCFVHIIVCWFAHKKISFCFSLSLYLPVFLHMSCELSTEHIHIQAHKTALVLSGRTNMLWLWYRARIQCRWRAEKKKNRFNPKLGTFYICFPCARILSIAVPCLRPMNVGKN